ncbi:nucleolin [Phoenix dactylifera]|uniref:Nucleolin n=1 Tax=Phoenix dactylifera TaxID=42345 RepID=A0A8B7CE22_PHODC|nr:nucleolin [Phoenix dactylifera]XP_026662490.2 nucleolin [Phoenix dactylifera]
MSGSTERGRKDKGSSLANSEKDVEALLRAAQDDLLLKLRVDSHPISSHPSSSFSASSAASAGLNPDLVHRLEALKSNPPPSPAAPPPPPSKPAEKGAVAAAATEGGDDEWGRILGVDLAARFAALKGSSSGHNPGFQRPDLVPNLGDSNDEAGAVTDGDDGASEKEVEKVMQWAMDAARLDPLKSDKDGDDDVDGVNTDDDDEKEEEEEDLNEKKRKEMNKGKPKKWFFF